MATSACSLGLLADRTPLITSARDAAGPILLAHADPPGAAGRSRSLTATNQTPVSDQVEDISTPPSVADLTVVPSEATVSNRLPNAPAKLRRVCAASKHAWISRAPSASAGC
jgi:hypothetical protein